ncbi:MBL fold metallo-hydrolase [Paeniglutamicibacter sp. ABSL32-1]|uniref:MBL fold metallo-hydrolase n=1 Tax=Paeniglutamicibacter quisquiliarum TaxID=2849498 RepID=UPI001C2D55BA|nr:MBL fold metallo-hydrolase [Paeniglutamicibacter quisquiliarum]MBV1777580.1 MBL fold metallo-hydrolase [Paeniglutamicibacter quisquiliarum]
MTDAEHSEPIPYVVTLGTAGGPRWWKDHDGTPRFGIATAVVVGETWYLVDCGQGAGRQANAAGLSMSNLGGIFITHMHSDHTVDLPSLLLFGAFELKNSPRGPIPVVGPGDRGKLPPLSPRATSMPEPIAPDRPTPGIEGLVSGILAAYATDCNDRIFDSLAISPAAQFDPREIKLPEGLGFDPDSNVAPDMEPIEVFRDGNVTVTAILVSHHPTAPAYAFRFDTPHGSVTISGDTAPCANMVTLARGTDLLLHEAINLDILAAQYSDAQMLQATMDHHRRAHTTAAEAGQIAADAGVAHLALHHLVPSYSPPEAWTEARTTFGGALSIPDDLEIIPFGTASRVTGNLAASGTNNR